MPKYQVYFLGIVVVIVLFINGCVIAKAPFVPPKGGIVTMMKAPLQIEFPEKGVGYSSTSGSASTLYVHDPIFTGMSFAWNACSIKEATQNGKLTNVEYADYECFQVLGIFGKTTVKVYGTPCTQ